MTAISVVVTTRDAHQWLAEALASIRAQTHPRAEVETIVVGGADDTAAEIARAFLVCNAMQGKVLTAPRGSGLGTALELGWRAAGGQWVQFLNGRDVLAPNKFELQSGPIARLPEEIGVIFSSWQRLHLAGGQWLLAGPVEIPQLSEPLVVRLLASAPLGSALIRTRSLAASVGMFGDGADALAAQLLLKVAAAGGVRAGSLCAGCAAVDLPLPLFFARDIAEPRASQLERAQQQLEGTLAARAILRRAALLTPAHTVALASLCRDRLHVLQSLDRAAYRSGVRRVRATDPHLLPSAKAVSGSLRRRSGTGLPAEVGEARANAGASAWSGRRMGLVAAMVVLVALLGAAVALGPLANYRGPAAQLERTQAEHAARPAPTIVVASTIYAELSSAWPLPVAIIPRQAAPPGGTLQITGLPSHATLSAGRRSASGAWTVPVAALANLEVAVSAGASGRSSLTLTLYSADRRVLAEVATTIEIDEPPAHGSAAGAEVRPVVPPPPVRIPAEAASGPVGDSSAREDAGGGAPESASREFSARAAQEPDALPTPATTAAPSATPRSHTTSPPATAPRARIDAPASSAASAPEVRASAGVQAGGEKAAAFAHRPPEADAIPRSSIPAPVADLALAPAAPIIAATPDGDKSHAPAIPAEPSAATADSAPPIAALGNPAAVLPQPTAPLTSASADLPATRPDPRLREATPPAIGAPPPSAPSPETADPRGSGATEAGPQPRAPMPAATVGAAGAVALVAPERQSEMLRPVPTRSTQVDAAADEPGPSPPSGSSPGTAAPAKPATPEVAALPPATTTASQAPANPATREGVEAAAQADRRLLTTLLARGERDLAEGNVAMARQCFLRAAEAGMARGALLLAQTYDAHELARLGVQGMQGNARLARIWYQRARELGASEAEPLLRSLGGAD